MENWSKYVFITQLFPKTIAIHLISIDVFLFPVEPRLSFVVKQSIPSLT